jgi:hypothetical protein
MFECFFGTVFEMSRLGIPTIRRNRNSMIVTPDQIEGIGFDRKTGRCGCSGLNNQRGITLDTVSFGGIAGKYAVQMAGEKQIRSTLSEYGHGTARFSNNLSRLAVTRRKFERVVCDDNFYFIVGDGA